MLNEREAAEMYKGLSKLVLALDPDDPATQRAARLITAIGNEWDARALERERQQLELQTEMLRITTPPKQGE